MKRKIIIIIILLVVLYLCIPPRENMEVDEVLIDNKYTWKEKILSFLSQKGLTVIQANKVYLKYKQTHPDVKDEIMYNNMVKNI